MTDDEIIKALECCQDKNFEACRECPLYTESYPECLRGLKVSALDLINRQKAERENEMRN